MSKSDAYIDVVELCVLLQALGFKVKYLDTGDQNLSQDGGSRNVVVSCQSSGLHVVLENTSSICTCPPNEKQNSGFWQVSGVSGGKQADKDSGSAILGALPKNFRDRISQQLKEIVGSIREMNELCSEGEGIKRVGEPNTSTSLQDMHSPEKTNSFLKPEASTRYRSLDTLTSIKTDPEVLPAPGQLQKKANDLSADEIKPDMKDNLQIMCARQSTYTISTPGSGSFRRRNKTSSPIHAMPNTMLENLVSAEKAAEELRKKLSTIVKDFFEDGKHDTSISSLALDVSKISVVKAAESSRTQFASSPNLSGIGPTREELTKSRLKRFESASTSNLARSAPKEGKIAKLRRLSPNFFKRKDMEAKDDKTSKQNAVYKPKIVTPVRTPKAEPSPNLSSNKKKYSHIKSTIPRPTTAKKD